MDSLTYKYHPRKGHSCREVYLVLHGGMAGIESPFISQLISAITDSQRNVLGFNMPYLERGEQTASDGLSEEVATLAEVVAFLRKEGYEKITIVAKSLGAIVTSFYLENNRIENLDVIVLGYVIGEVKTSAIAPYLRCVIQGELDRFGNRQAVLEELSSTSTGKNIEIIELAGADHSYRNTAGETEFQQAAIDYLLANLD